MSKSGCRISRATPTVSSKGITVYQSSNETTRTNSVVPILADIPLVTGITEGIYAGSPTFIRAGTATFTDFDGNSHTAVANEVRVDNSRYVNNLCLKSANASDGWTKDTGVTAVGDVVTLNVNDDYVFYALTEDPDSQTYRATFTLAGTEGEAVSVQWLSTGRGLTGDNFILTSDERRYTITTTFPAGAQSAFRLYLIRQDSNGDDASVVTFKDILIENVTNQTQQASSDRYVNGETTYGSNAAAKRHFTKEIGVNGLAVWGDSLTKANHGLATDHMWAQQIMGAFNINKLERGGVSGETSTQIETRALASSAEVKGFTTIIWVGRNNITQQATIESDISDIVADLSTTNYLVLGVTNKRDGTEDTDSTNYNHMVSINSALASTYGSRFVDVWSLLRANADLTDSTDVADLAAGRIPNSLMADATHMNDAGYKIIADRLITILESNGWLTEKVGDDTGCTGYIVDSTALDELTYPITGNIPSSGNDFTLAIEWTPTATTANQYIVSSYTDGNNYLMLFWTTANNLIFRKRVATVIDEATISLTPSNETTYKIAIRMSKVSGMDIFLNGTKGTGNTDTIDIPLGTNLEIGMFNSGFHADSRFKNLKIYDGCLTDAECEELTT